MIPLSMLLKRKDNTEAAVATDSADCACACDAAPKKQQTLEQHLKQYHHGQMPKGDCSWLKQYKKDHPDWQKDAAKVSKGEAAVDTAKKDAAPKGKKSDKSIEEEINAAVKRVSGQFWVDTGTTHGAESRMEADRKMLAALLADPPDIAEAMKNASLNAYTPSVHALMNGLSRNYGHIDIGRRAIENAIKNATDEELEKEYAGANSFDAVKKMAEAEIAARKSKGKGGKKSSASEYLDAVEKDRKSKKTEKKDGKDSDVRLPNYPSKEDMKKNFDFDKAEKTIMDSVSSTGDITDIDSDILGDGCLTLSFGLKKGSKFGKPAKALLGDALEKMGIPRSAMEDPIPGTREDSAIVVVKLDSLIDKSLADNGGKGNNDPNTPEYIVENESVEDIEALFSDNARKLIVANARKSAKKSGYDQFILWSPALGWGYTRDHGQKDSFKDFGQEIMGKVEIVNDGNIQYPEFHVNTDFDRMKPVKHYEAIQKLLEAKKKELAK